MAFLPAFLNLLLNIAGMQIIHGLPRQLSKNTLALEVKAQWAWGTLDQGKHAKEMAPAFCRKTGNDLCGSTNLR